MQGNQMTTTTTTILDYILLLSLSSYLLKTILGNLSSLKEGFTSLWALKIIGCLFLTIVARPINYSVKMAPIADGSQYLCEN